MNDVDSMLSTALREEAEEISMSVDLTKGAGALDERLDRADRRKRRTTWIIAASAAVVLVAAVIGARALGERHDSSPVVPTPTPTRSASPYTSTAFAVPLTLTPPGWTVPTSTLVDDLAPTRITWAQSECAPPAPCDWGSDFGLRVIAPSTYFDPAHPDTPTPVTTYAGYVDYLETWAANGVTVSDRSETTVGGRPAVVVTMRSTAPPSGMWGCELPTEAKVNCWGPVQGVAVRFAVVDAPGRPILIWTKASEQNPSAAQSFQDFDTMLGTVTFGPAPSSS